MRLAKLAISAGVATADTALAATRRSRLRGGVTLLYHDIPLAYAPSFEQQLAMLARRHCVVSLAGLRARPLRGAVAITFDDAFASFVDVAVPRLARHGFPSTLFVPSALVDDDPQPFPYGPDGAAAPTLATWAELAGLPSDLVTLGSHGRRHLDLRTLTDEELDEELTGSRVEISSHTGHTVTLHAYPYGGFDARVQRAAGRAGYEAAVTVEPHLAHRHGGTGRVVVEPTDWPVEFRLKAAGAYRWMGWYMAAKRRLHAVS